MPEYIGLNSKLTYQPGVSHDLSSSLSINNLGRNSLEDDITFYNDALTAQKASFKKVTIEVYIDDGRGYLVQVPGSEVASDLQIKESMDGWADELDISLVGEKYSPLVSSLIRGKQKVEVWITYGSPGNEFRTSIPAFSGYIMDGSFSDRPPVAKLTCLDAAILYSEQKADYSLAVNSGKTRMDILTELLDQATSVPRGIIDLGGDGGKVNKSISTGTDARRFDFIRDFMSPVGALMWFSNGNFNIQKFDKYAPIQRVLEKSDLANPVVIDTPPTTEANVIKAVAVRYSGGGTDITTETKIEEWKKVYSRQSGRKMQLITPGMQDPPDVVDTGWATDPPVERVVRRIITTNTYQGSTLMKSEIDEYAWYSPLIGRLALTSSGGAHTSDWIGGIGNRNAYLFEDGQWHKDPMEIFQLIRKTIMNKTATLGGWIIKQVEDQYFYHFTHQALYQVQTNATPPPDLYEFNLNMGLIIPVTEQGDGLYQQVESIGILGPSGSFMLNGEPAMIQFLHPDSSRITEWSIKENGQIDVETETQQTWGKGLKMSSSSNGAYHYGVTSKEYYNQRYETFDSDKTIVTTSYNQIDEETYQTTEVTTAPDPSDSTIHTLVNKGSIPFAEKIQPKSDSQEMSVTLTDGTRVALSGATQDEIHNEYCENEAELRTVAAMELRMRSAMNISLKMPIEGQIHKAMWIAVDMPEIGLTSDKKMLVWNVTRVPGKFTQDLECKYFPPEVLNL